MKSRPKALAAAMILAKPYLDLLATVLVIALAASLLWRSWAGRLVSAAAAPTRVTRTAPAAPALPTEPLSVAGALLRGSADAKVAVIEFSDFQCPFCSKFVDTTMADLTKKYVDTGKVLFAFRQFPLEQIHSLATRAAEAAECAAEQQKFWPMHDQLFAKPTAIDEQAIRSKAKGIGLDMKVFDACMAGPIRDRVTADVAAGTAAGVRGTPTFLLGVVEADRRVRIKAQVYGAAGIDQFVAPLEELLKKGQVGG